ncbi:MAG: hypothetical protein L0229_31725 [Blastocatellia bacterium]|nr:hypothetical protein [Blastocatellia bacterium]
MKRSLSLIFSLGLMATIAGCDIKTNRQVPQVNVANELAVTMRLRAIADAEAFYFAESGGSYATLDELVEKGYVPDPSGGKLDGYRFDVRVKLDGFEATAVPKKFGITGRRSFYIDETKVLRGADKGGDPATASDPQA